MGKKVKSLIIYFVCFCVDFMEGYSLIKIFEVQESLRSPVGVVRIKGEALYKRVRQEIVDDGIFELPFHFLVANDCVLSERQEEKWLVDGEIVYIKSTSNHSETNHISSKQSCTIGNEPTLQEESPNVSNHQEDVFERPSLVPKDILQYWEEGCKRVRTQLKNLAVPRDDRFELKVEELEGKGIVRIWCHECNEPYGSGSSEGKLVAYNHLSNFFRSHIRSKNHERWYYSKRGLVNDQHVSTKRLKVDDASVIATSLEEMENFNQINKSESISYCH